MKKVQSTAGSMGIDIPPASAEGNVNKLTSGEELIKITDVNQYFEIVEEERGKMLRMGRYQLTDWAEDISNEKLIKQVESKDWGLIMTVASIVAEDVINQMIDKFKKGEER